MTNNTKLTNRTSVLIITADVEYNKLFFYFTLLEIGCFSTNIMPDYT